MGETVINSTGYVEVTVSDIPDIAQLETQWLQLATVVRPSYFLSWGWVGTWLRWLPPSIEPKLLEVKRNGDTVGLALLVKSRQARRGLILASNMIFVNETGDPDYDLLTIEYNGLLLDPLYARESAIACLDYLHKQEKNWDELIVRAADSSNQLTDPELFEHESLRLKVTRTRPSWFVDLNEIRETNKSYLENLSSNTRYQIRRAVRDCEKLGDIEFSYAQTTEEALQYLSGLIELHQAYWTGQGENGCFANPLFLKFHQRLIRERFGLREIQLVSVKLGTHILGYLYSLVSYGHVNFYQCGFNYQLGEKLKPGLVAHYKAIEYNMASGNSIYDFLAGDDRYKRSLSTDKHELLWVSIQKNRLRFRLEDAFNGFVLNFKNTVRHRHKLYGQAG